MHTEASPEGEGQARAQLPIAREIAGTYLGIALVTLLVSYLPLPFTGGYGHLLLAAAFLGTALYRARGPGGDAAHYGIDLSGVLEPRRGPDGRAEPLGATLRRALPETARELGIALLACLLIFPPFIFGFRVFHAVDHPFTLHLPHALGDFVLGQLLLVALPEEALFRGYFQTRLERLWPARFRLLGVALSPEALSCQAALFALLHFLVGFAPARLLVFFPGLVFGLLRTWRGGIGAALWFHAFCNFLSELLSRGYL
jgi:membrane protease YdiL (CAAX protease family)